jgi:hypothetical protein
MLPPSSLVTHVENHRAERRELPYRIHRRPSLLVAAGKGGVVLVCQIGNRLFSVLAGKYCVDCVWLL